MVARRGAAAVIRAAVAASGIAFVALLGPASCAPAPEPPRPGARAVVVRAGADRPITSLPTVAVEVASTRAARERGLSGRERLAPDAGMLFVYADDRPRRFWMKDCWMALDLGFLRADGTIAAVHTLPAGAGRTGADVPAATCPEPVRYVLETNAGWYAAHGLRPGHVVDVSAAVAGVVPE